MMATSSPRETAEREVVVSRTFDAPRDKVFEAWTAAEKLDRWWGPNGFSNTTHQMDFRPGGSWTYTMHGPDGTDYPNYIKYLEIVRPQRLFYDHGTDAESAAHFRVTVDFVDRGGKT